MNNLVLTVMRKKIIELRRHSIESQLNIKVTKKDVKNQTKQLFMFENPSEVV